MIQSQAEVDGWSSVVRFGFFISRRKLIRHVRSKTGVNLPKNLLIVN
jgi:hypothetical protein